MLEVIVVINFELIKRIIKFKAAFKENGSGLCLWTLSFNVIYILYMYNITYRSGQTPSWRTYFKTVVFYILTILYTKLIEHSSLYYLLPFEHATRVMCHTRVLRGKVRPE